MDYAAYAKAIREELHRIPELGFDLPKTLKVVHRELDDMGLEYTDKYGPSSVVAVINEDKPFTIALRADMDALPIQEKNDVPYKSTHEGIMHACGHDAHTAVLLAVAKKLMDNRDRLNCRVKLMFTPAEEYETPGCKILAENGIMDDVDCAVALHVSAKLSVGHIELTAQDLGGNSAGFKVRFYGKAAHAMEQQNGVDAIMMALEAISAMEYMVAKEIPIQKLKMLNIGTIHGGKTNNVICDYVEIFGSCRAAEDETSACMERRLQEICQGVALATGGRVEFEKVKFLPYRINNPILYEKFYETAARLIGEEKIHDLEFRDLGGEDFGFLSRIKPCLYFSFGVKDPKKDTFTPVHTDGFDIQPDSYQLPIDLITQFVFDNMNGIDFRGN